MSLHREIECFYLFLIFVDFNAFMFSSLNLVLDLKPSTLILPWDCQQKDTRESKVGGGLGQRGRSKGISTQQKCVKYLYNVY